MDFKDSARCGGCVDTVPSQCICRHFASGLQPGLCLQASLDGLVALTQGCNQPFLQWAFYPVSGASAALNHTNTTLCLHPAGIVLSSTLALCSVPLQQDKCCCYGSGLGDCAAFMPIPPCHMLLAHEQADGLASILASPSGATATNCATVLHSLACVC